MSYIKFIDLGIPDGLKTRRYRVQGANGFSIGQVRFNGAWRKFCFFPDADTVFDSNCLNEIAGFCQQQNDIRRSES